MIEKSRRLRKTIWILKSFFGKQWATYPPEDGNGHLDEPPDENNYDNNGDSNGYGHASNGYSNGYGHVSNGQSNGHIDEKEPPFRERKYSYPESNGDDLGFDDGSSTNGYGVPRRQKMTIRHYEEGGKKYYEAKDPYIEMEWEAPETISDWLTVISNIVNDGKFLMLSEGLANYAEKLYIKVKNLVKEEEEDEGKGKGVDKKKLLQSLLNEKKALISLKFDLVQILNIFHQRAIELASKRPMEIVGKEKRQGTDENEWETLCENTKKNLMAAIQNYREETVRATPSLTWLVGKDREEMIHDLRGYVLSIFRILPMIRIEELKEGSLSPQPPTPIEGVYEEDFEEENAEEYKQYEAEETKQIKRELLSVWLDMVRYKLRYAFNRIKSMLEIYHDHLRERAKDQSTPQRIKDAINKELNLLNSFFSSVVARLNNFMHQSDIIRDKIVEDIFKIKNIETKIPVLNEHLNEWVEKYEETKQGILEDIENYRKALHQGEEGIPLPPDLVEERNQIIQSLRRDVLDRFEGILSVHPEIAFK